VAHSWEFAIGSRVELTPREMSLLRELAESKSNQKIAATRRQMPNGRRWKVPARRSNPLQD
jgi:hypothetical protein